MRVPRVLVVAGVSSGVGKTTVTLGLLEAFRRRGLAMQAFKVGPDFIDPGFHELVTRRPSYNLDGWMCGRGQVLETVARHAADADLALVEGVMGCFDGVDGTSEEGSTAQVAKWLGAPVVLVIDARSQSRSVGAVVLGFERFDPDLRIAAVISNRVGGEVHARWVHDAIASSCRAVPVGAIKRDEALTLPERHLGLVTAAEGTLTSELRRRLAEIIERSVDLDRLLEISAPLRDAARASPAPPSPPSVRIGVARDTAFQFYYAENLDRLRAAGAELVFWSPLIDGELPHVDGLYFGGGYPELHAARLAANADLRKAIRRFAEAGRPIYAECGGLMYLVEALEDLEGATHSMVGVLPTTVRMRPRRLTLGYTEVAFTADAPIGNAGTTARGHEFHYSSLDPVPESVPRAYRLTQRRGGERQEGYLVEQTLMSYVHLHFGSNPALATWFVRACRGEGR
ncbi:MAG: cobyrinate a,c-diamide synthase [candidate division NC10 bacterium]|nr:cobyrinate a,c-diamide synthase [candidate division NC10 bacterium]